MSQRRVIVQINGGGSAGPPLYTHFRFRTNNTHAWSNGVLLCVDAVVGTGPNVSFFFDSSLGTGSTGYVSVSGNDYIVIAGLHTKPGFPGDVPAALADIEQTSTQADDGDGDCSPTFDLGNQAVDSTVDYEPCFRSGIRDDDP